jgi:ferric-dicitrate binding protein FerR (iron transport regulator)
MNKTDRLLQMLEQPQRYTADEWQEILADEECRELYTLMSKTQSAIDAARADEDVTDEMMDAEWRRLAKPHSGMPTLLKIAAMLTFGRACSHSGEHMQASLSSRLVASFIGVLMLAGIAFAAIHIVSHRVGGEENHGDSSMIGSQTTITRPVPVISQDTIPQPHLFENVPLDEVVKEMALYYNKVVDIQNEQAHELRLYYKWDRKDDIGTIVEDLNHFDHVNLAVEGDRLIVKP